MVVPVKAKQHLAELGCARAQGRGDMGDSDADGFITLRDRSRDVIISGGTNICPHQVEEVLLTHPEVADVAAIGRAHRHWGKDLVVHAVAESGAGINAGMLKRGSWRASPDSSDRGSRASLRPYQRTPTARC